jgi:hypothetical protein
MCALQVLDSAGRRRSPATMPGYRSGRPPRNKGMRYPADPQTVEEIIAVMRLACHLADQRLCDRVDAFRRRYLAESVGERIHPCGGGCELARRVWLE